MLGLMLLPLLAAGVLGSAHCVAMCSPFAAAASRGGVRGSLAYSAGRLTAYAALGGAAGGLGASFAAISGASAALAILAGAALAAMGAQRLGLGPRWAGGGRVLDPVYRALIPLVRACVATRRADQSYLLGVLNGLLPCPVTGPVLLAAVASGSAGAGSALLLAVGAGTLPAMLLAGPAGRRVLHALGRRPPLRLEVGAASGAVRTASPRTADAGGAGFGARLTTRLGRLAPAVAMLLLGLVTAARPLLQTGAAHMHGV